MIPSHDQPGVAVNDADQQARPAIEGPGAGSIDKVRDILFGSQIRDFERRFARLEERLVKETSDLRADVRARLDALETYTRGEAESLAGQIRSEHDGRVESHQGLARESSEANRALERRAAALDEALAKSQRELRHQMLEQHQRLSDEIRARIDEVLARLSREAQELRSDKTDRAALASLLTEMALRLTNDFHLPEAEEAGHA